jgi:hypothetical protein
MKTALPEQILSYASQRSEGSPLAAKELLHLGTRVAVDQSLSRLTRRGELMRVGRGLYVRPIESRFGSYAPPAEKVVEEVARLRGETVVSHGAAAANALGLTTQVPMKVIYLTSGPSRRLKLGAQWVELKHAPRWQLANAGQPAGEAVRALAWLGPTRAPQALTALKSRLPANVLAEIAESRATLPEWLAQTVGTALVANA